MDNVVLMQVFQPGYHIDELSAISKSNKRVRALPLLTRCRRLHSGWDPTKFMMFPFSICSETIEMSGGVNITPTKGRIFSCRSHFHPTTSFTRGLGSGLNGHSAVLEHKLLTICTFLGSAALVTLRVFTTTGRPWNVALYTSEDPPESNGTASRLSNVDGSMNDDGRMTKIPHSSRKCFRYCFRFRLVRPPLSRV